MYLMMDVPVEEISRALLRPVVNRQFAVHEQFCSSSNSKTQIIVSRLIHGEFASELDCPRISQTRRQEVV